MTMADSDRKFFTDLVTEFKKEIIDAMERKFSSQEKLFDAKLDPIGKQSERFRIDIDNLYDKNRTTISEISGIKTELKGHIENHNTGNKNARSTIAIIVSVLAIITSILLKINLGG